MTLGEMSTGALGGWRGGGMWLVQAACGPWSKTVTVHSGPDTAQNRDQFNFN